MWFLCSCCICCICLIISIIILCFNSTILGRTETHRRTATTSSSEDRWVRSILSATAWTSRTFLSTSSPLKMVRATISMWTTGLVNKGLQLLLKNSNSSNFISGVPGMPGSILVWVGQATVDPVFSCNEMMRQTWIDHRLRLSNHLPLLEVVIWEDYVCARSEGLIVEDDNFFERFNQRESLTKNPKKTFLRHLVNQVQAAGTVDVAFAGE